MGRVREARREFEECIDVSGRNDAAGAAARFHLARLLVEQNMEKDRAVALLKDALETPSVTGGLSGGDLQEAKELLSQLTGS